MLLLHEPSSINFQIFADIVSFFKPKLFLLSNYFTCVISHFLCSSHFLSFMLSGTHSNQVSSTVNHFSSRLPVAPTLPNPKLNFRCSFFLVCEQHLSKLITFSLQTSLLDSLPTSLPTLLGLLCWLCSSPDCTCRRASGFLSTLKL